MSDVGGNPAEKRPKRTRASQKSAGPKPRARKPQRKVEKWPLPGVSRLGLNISLAAFILISSAMVAVLENQSPEITLNSEPVRLALQITGHPGDLEAPPLHPIDEEVFSRLTQRRLPRYLDYFKEEARRHGLPWKLLAAQAYQESQWNPRAVSPTGVRGIMMLTQTTSASLGIRNRTDPKQSIRGGARHLAELLQSLSPQIQEPDRTWIALASYNVGRGHVMDAMKLARRFGKNPHSWDDLKEVLPLLARKQYYRTLPHRYARGWEPVQYVQRIRAFWNILHRTFDEPSAIDRSQL